MFPSLFRRTTMKTGLTALGIALCVAAARGDDAKKELEKFSGFWQAVSITEDGKDQPDAVKTTKLTVKGEQYTYNVKDQVVEGTHKLDPSKKPKEIDAVRSKGPDAGKTLKGIYVLTDDTFTVCFAAAGKERPTDFKSKTGDGRRLMEFKRVKP
jgi:uncharacterized protein (TIGR03067 family)